MMKNYSNPYNGRLVAFAKLSNSGWKEFGSHRSFISELEFIFVDVYKCYERRKARANNPPCLGDNFDLWLSLRSAQVGC